jgi:hypothetical protein
VRHGDAHLESFDVPDRLPECIAERVSVADTVHQPNTDALGVSFNLSDAAAEFVAIAVADKAREP